MADGHAPSARPAAAPRRARPPRRARRPWTAAEDRLLRDRWGEDSARTLTRKLGRSETAIYQHAYELKLPPQAQGRTLVTRACRAVGVWHDTLYRLLDECGMRAAPAAPVRQHPGDATHYRKLVVEQDAVGDLLAVRDGRTLRLFEWARHAGVCGVAALHRMRKAGAIPPGGGHVRYPVGVLEEVDRARRGAAASGPWLDLWRRVIAVDDAPCSPWVAALAAWDLSHGPPAPPWVEHLPQGVASLARRLAARAGGRP